MLEKPLEKYPAESVVFDIDCTALLASSEVIQGTPSMAWLCDVAGATALTFAAAQVNSAPVTYPDGVTAAAGKVVQVKISGGAVAAGSPLTTYAVTATFGTSLGNTMVGRSILRVLNPAPGPA
jgi:hypothetical protein